MQPPPPPQGRPLPAHGHSPDIPPPGYPQQGYQMGPPPKKRIPGWAIALIVVAGVFLFLFISILALAAIPLITTNTHDARRAEGEQLMSSAMNQARVQYARTAEPALTLTECGMSSVERRGKYFIVDDPIGNSGDYGVITCQPTRTDSDGRGRLTFSWTRGDTQVSWE